MKINRNKLILNKLRIIAGIYCEEREVKSVRIKKGRKYELTN